MPYCLAPSESIFSKNGKCGNKTIPNSKLQLCQIHYNLLLNSPEHHNNSFSSNPICMICKSKNSYNYYKYGICSNCMLESDTANLNLTCLLKTFINSPYLYNTSDSKIKKLLKKYLVEIDDTLPQDFNIIFCKNSVKIIDELAKPLITIKIDRNKYFSYSFYKHNGLLTCL